MARNLVLCFPLVVVIVGHFSLCNKKKHLFDDNDFVGGATAVVFITSINI